MVLESIGLATMVVVGLCLVGGGGFMAYMAYKISEKVAMPAVIAAIAGAAVLACAAYLSPYGIVRVAGCSSCWIWQG